MKLVMLEHSESIFNNARSQRIIKMPFCLQVRVCSFCDVSYYLLVMLRGSSLLATLTCCELCGNVSRRHIGRMGGGNGTLETPVEIRDIYTCSSVNHRAVYLEDFCRVL